MSTKVNIMEAVASGEEIGLIVNKIEDALDGTPRGHAIISLLSLVLVIMNPQISADQLQEAVKNVSQYICLSLDAPEGMEEAKVTLN